MRTLTLVMTAFIAIVWLVPVYGAEVLPLRSRAGVHAGFAAGTCRAPPWYRGWQRLAPWVCADYWWSPRFYYAGTGVRYRRHYRVR